MRNIAYFCRMDHVYIEFLCCAKSTVAQNQFRILNIKEILLIIPSTRYRVQTPALSSADNGKRDIQFFFNTSLFLPEPIIATAVPNLNTVHSKNGLLGHCLAAMTAFLPHSTSYKWWLGDAVQDCTSSTLQHFVAWQPTTTMYFIYL